jgi:hypothetical protein
MASRISNSIRIASIPFPNWPSTRAAIARRGDQSLRNRLFSSACGSEIRERASGFHASGYVEIAFNWVQAIADPVQYAALFVRFDQCARQRGFDAR